MNCLHHFSLGHKENTYDHACASSFLTDPIYYPWPQHVLMKKEWPQKQWKSRNGNMFSTTLF